MIFDFSCDKKVTFEAARLLSASGHSVNKTNSGSFHTTDNPLGFSGKQGVAIRDGIATIRPNSVVIKASEIPVERDFASPVPKIVIN